MTGASLVVVSLLELARMHPVARGDAHRAIARSFPVFVLRHMRERMGDSSIGRELDAVLAGIELRESLGQ